jgi:hypothetical protein
MSDATSPFAFSQFVPGFDFLKNLAGGANPGGGAVPGLPSLSNWVAPTLSVEEVDKRIQELKTVQYWLEQNGHALKATIQALEVQKMTLSTLRGMNVQMEDLAKAFTRTAATAAEPMAPPAAPPSAPAEASAPEPAETEPSPSEPPQKPGKGAAPGVVDPLQWWNALTQQFQQIAQTAVEDAGQLKMPGAAGASVARPTAAKRTTPKKAVAKKTSTKTAKTTARKTPTASRPRSR